MSRDPICGPRAGMLRGFRQDGHQQSVAGDWRTRRRKKQIKRKERSSSRAHRSFKRNRKGTGRTEPLLFSTPWYRMRYRLCTGSFPLFGSNETLPLLSSGFCDLPKSYRAALDDEESFGRDSADDASQTKSNTRASSSVAGFG